MSDINQSLQAFLDDDALSIPPIKSTKHPEGKGYRVESPTAEAGIRLSALANLGMQAAVGNKVNPDELKALSLSDEEEATFMKQVLGDTYDELIEDGVSWVRIQRLSQFAFAYFAVSPQAANKAVESGAFLGKAPTPVGNREERRKATKDSTGAKSARQGSGAGKSRKPKQD